MKKILLLLAITICGFANAQVLFNDDFTTYTVGQTLSGQGTWTNNSSNNGGLGSCAGALCVNSKIQANALTYPNYGSCINALSIAPEQDAVGTPLPVTNSGSFYVSFVVNFSNAVLNPGGTTSQDFFRVMSGGNYNTSMRMGAFKVGSNFQLFIQKGSGTKVFTPDLAFNQNHLVILKYTFITAGTTDDLVSLFVDPDVTMAEPTATVSTSSLGATESDYTGGIDRFCFRQNWSTIPTGYVGIAKTALLWTNLRTLATNQFTKSTFEIISNNIGNGVLTVKSALNLEKAALNIYDMQGRNISKHNIAITEGPNDFAVTPLKAGIYIVEIASGNERIATKIVVQ
jgi:hypothetical protein